LAPYAIRCGGKLPPSESDDKADWIQQIIKENVGKTAKQTLSRKMKDIIGLKLFGRGPPDFNGSRRDSKQEQCEKLY
jgi:hypothetical protein